MDNQDFKIKSRTLREVYIPIQFGFNAMSQCIRIPEKPRTTTTLGYANRASKSSDHPGMMFRFRDRKVEMDMVEHIENMMKEFPIKFKEINENVTPAGVDLFSKDLSEKLNEEMRTIFH